MAVHRTVPRSWRRLLCREHVVPGQLGLDRDNRLAIRCPACGQPIFEL